MNVFTAYAILQIFLVVRGSDVPEERKRVGCFYFGATSERYGTLFPEDIDASICTHLYYVHGAINNETGDIYLKPPTLSKNTGGEGFVPRLAKLKENNPDLKLLLHILYGPSDGILEDPSSRSNIIQSGVRWLNESGFDGLDIDAPVQSQYKEEMADFICEMKNEFDKYGFIVTASLNRAAQSSDESIRKVSRCSDHIMLITHYHLREFHRIAPMSMIKSNVDFYRAKGVPAGKILISIPAFGSIFVVEEPTDENDGARAYKPGNDDLDIMGGFGIRNKELHGKLNDSSLEWTMNRDKDTEEPSAFTTTGLWISYEDVTSMEHKANYVMQENLGGVNIVALDFDDDDGTGGEGRFPLTRAVHNVLRGNQSADNNN